jgi:hypothetical protein
MLTVSGTTAREAVAEARKSDAEIVVAATGDRWPAGALEELLALLQAPGTAVAAARGVAGTRVASSGWVADEAGEAFDPWAGSATSDPGYLNLALVAAPRALPADAGWVAWRESLLAGWDAAPDLPDAWRLAVGLARLDLETVVSPEASVLCPPPPPPPPRPPTGLPVHRTRWASDLGLL